MNWRKKIMDQKDLMLLKARSVMESTKRALEQILEADDDAVLSAKVIGETDGEEDMQTTETQEEKTPIQKAREYVFARASELSYRITPAQAEHFYDEMMWSRFPAVNHERIFEFFRDPRYEYPDLPANPRYYTSLQFSHSADTRIRFDAVCEIITLFDELHRMDPSNDIYASLRKWRQRYERMKAQNETPEQTARRHAFEQISQWTGKPEKQIAKVYDAINWNDDRVQDTEQDGSHDGGAKYGPRAKREQLIHENLTPEPEYPPSAVERQQRAQRRGDRRPIDLTDPERASLNAQRDVRERMTKMIYAIFLDMRAEIARLNQQQSLKAARKAELARQIERTKAEFERLNAA